MKKLDDWYKAHGPVVRFFANVALMATVVTVMVGGAGLYAVMFGYTLHIAITISPWFLFLLIGEISIPIGIWFAIDMHKEDKWRGR